MPGQAKLVLVGEENMIPAEQVKGDSGVSSELVPHHGHSCV